MPTDRAIILRYLHPPRGSFWRWDDDGRGLAWGTGQTIAFREELLLVLRRMADGKIPLPPFAAILLLLAATRDNWSAVGPKLIDHAQRLAESGGGDITSAVGVNLRAIGHRLVADATDLIAALENIARLPADHRRSPSAKATLSEVVFESYKNSTSLNPADVLTELETGTDPGTFDPMFSSSNFALRELIDAMDALRPALNDLTPDRLKMRARTGLDGVVKKAEIEIGPTDRARRLMAETSDDPDVAAVTRIARGLMAAIAVPRPVGQPDDRPAGGVTDISNRGPLDRLLLSELAHDDLTLAVRVAVNEALYMQRETPPRHPPRNRAIFIDTGLRVWGVPRIFAAAVALALAAGTDSDGDVAAFRAGRGPFLLPADLTSREGLIDHLSALDGRAHFGETLGAFAAFVDERGDTTEPFLITHPDVLDDPDFQRAMREHGPESAYAAAVDRDGSFTLWHLSPAGRRVVRKAKLDLEQLVESPLAKAPQSAPLDGSKKQPAIFSIKPFPLRLPPTCKIIATAVHSEAGVIGITQDRRLLHWDSLPNRGPIQLSTDLPHGRVRSLLITKEKAAIAVIQPHNKTADCVVLIADLNSGEVSIRSLGAIPPSAAFAVENGLLCVSDHSKITAFNLADLSPVASIVSSGELWSSGVIYREPGREGDDFARLTFDGSELRLLPLPVSDPRVLLVFNLSNGDIYAVQRDGRIYAPLKPNQPDVVAGDSSDFGLAEFSDSNQRLTASTRLSNGKIHHRIFDMSLGGGNAFWQWRQSFEPTDLLPGVPHWMPGRLRARFDRIAVSAEGALVLARGDKLVYFSLKLNPDEETRLLPYEKGISTNRWQHFLKPRKGIGDDRWLSFATWPNGSEAMMDRRGLLHLRDALNGCEMTFVLANHGPVSVWTTWSDAFGDPYCCHPIKPGFVRCVSAFLKSFAHPLQ